MKGIRPILFLLVMMLLVGQSTSVSIAFATQDSTCFDDPGGSASSGDDEVTVDGKDPGQGEGDPDHYGDGNEVIEMGGTGDGFDSVIIGEQLLQLMYQLRLLVL